MTLITHPKAQSLLQAAADSALAPQDEICLNDHLAECDQCRQYARRLSKLEDSLRQFTRSRWNQTSEPLSTEKIKSRLAKAEKQAYNLRTISAFSVAIVVLAFVFILTINHPSAIRNIPAALGNLSPTPEEPALTPTPSIKGTTTVPTAKECNDLAYLVQENDTLEDIAARHSISKEAIKMHNGLSTDTLIVNMVLTIPLCEETPTNSTLTPTTTTTITP
jgi:LysM repeat protein